MRVHLVPACLGSHPNVCLTQDVQCDAGFPKEMKSSSKLFLLHHLAPECPSFIRPAPDILPPSRFLTCGSLGSSCSSSAHMPGSSELGVIGPCRPTNPHQQPLPALLSPLWVCLLMHSMHRAHMPTCPMAALRSASSFLAILVPLSAPST